MQAVPQVLDVMSRSSLDQADGGRTNSDAYQPAAQFQSADLLKGGRSVGIMHNGSLYRLQATKLGKLILTK